MSNYRERVKRRPHQFVNLPRLEALGDAIFAFALTLLALDLRLPEIASNGLAQGIRMLIPKLLIFIFTFLVIAQEWDVHQRTMMHIVRADGIFVWLYLLSLMFVVLMPTSADILGRFPVQPLALVFFGVNSALLCVVSWFMWQYASYSGRLLDDALEPYTIKMISRLWLFPPLVIVLTMPLGFFSVYPVYFIWVLMPVISYSYSAWLFKRNRKDRK